MSLISSTDGVQVWDSARFASNQCLFVACGLTELFGLFTSLKLLLGAAESHSLIEAFTTTDK